jgi:ABC-2 type transport system permease protein
VAACLLFAAAGNVIAGGSWDFKLSHLGEAALYELFGMLGALALGLLIMHSAAAIVTYFVLPTVVGIVVEVVSALHGPAEWFEPNRVTTPLAEGTIHGSGWAHFAVTFGVWVVVPLVAGMLRLRRHELK